MSNRNQMAVIYLKNLGYPIANIRKSLHKLTGISQPEMARKIGISRQSITKYIEGRRDKPAVKTKSPNVNARFNPHQILQFLLNENYHAGAIDEAFGALIKSWPPRLRPEAYIVGTLKKIDGNWRERDDIQSAAEIENAHNKLLKNPGIKNMIAGIGG
jgi:DNA-binding XRE family transcriptional regulator